MAGKIKEAPFKGVDWSQSVHRPGCQDHLQHPSRRGDQYVMHSGKPIHLASSVREFAAFIPSKLEVKS